MSIKIPNVRNEKGATTPDVIAEQIKLCKSTVQVIDEVAFYRQEREKRHEINRRLRGCNDFMGMSGSRKSGCLYKEVGLFQGGSVVCEHAIPVAALVRLYEDGVPFEDIVFYPIARISKESDRRLGRLGLAKSGYDQRYPFARYEAASILIETHKGDQIACDSWTMNDHWALVQDTEDLASVRCEVLKRVRGVIPPKRVPL